VPAPQKRSKKKEDESRADYCPKVGRGGLVGGGGGGGGLSAGEKKKKVPCESHSASSNPGGTPGGWPYATPKPLKNNPKKGPQR